MRLGTVGAAMVLWLAPAFAQNAGAQRQERIGTVTFPISCVSRVREPFERAIALLHSFVYQDAEQEFRKILSRDPKCAIALWGEAFSLYHPLWFPPDEDTLKRGHQLIERAQSMGPRTQREREFVEALRIFYKDHGYGSYADRTAAYAQAMKVVFDHYPGDPEAACFYALSLLSTEAPKTAPMANRLEAAAILKPLFNSLPAHPGVVHYLIHAYDTPELAAFGLPAALRYRELAPSESHAAHMPSHIFTLLGMWQEAIAANLAAIEVARRQGGMLPLHFLEFLSYAYLQVGREEDAEKIIARIELEGPNLVAGMRNHALLLSRQLAARRALELGRWSLASSLDPPIGGPRSAEAYTYLARAMGAARGGDPAAARRELQRFEALESPSDLNDPKTQVSDWEAMSWIAHGDGMDDEAIAKLRDAAELEECADSTAHDWLGASAREMLGDLFLELKRPADALVAYERALERTPNRFRALYGAASSSEQVGKIEGATRYYARLAAQSKLASSGRPELVRTREFLAGRADHSR